MTQQPTPTPDDATADQLADHLEGRPIRYSPDSVCKRCESKNALRSRYGDTDLEDLADETLDEGERIRFTAVYQDTPWLHGLDWGVQGLFHQRHPQMSQEEIAVQGTAQAMGTATLVRAKDAATVQRSPDDPGPDGSDLVLADVTVEFYSPPDEGEVETLPEGDEMIVAEGVNDRPDWPEEENEWRSELIENGPAGDP